MKLIVKLCVVALALIFLGPIGLVALLVIALAWLITSGALGVVWALLKLGLTSVALLIVSLFALGAWALAQVAGLVEHATRQRNPR